METEEFDAVVVGSGFGGSVMTYRLGKAGLKVCLLERGQRYPPGSFPRSPYEMKKNFWDPSKGLYGLFNIWSFDSLGAIVSSGLGGGSLIYANVLIRKPEEWFEDTDPTTGEPRPWPVGWQELQPHYRSVEGMLGAQPYPFDREPYSETSKAGEFQTAAVNLGFEHDFPDLAVTFAGEGEEPGEPIEDGDSNMHGVPRYTCRLVGECDIGCNFGSKNTLDLTYLSKAEKLKNVEIRCLSEVRSFVPRGGEVDSEGYIVKYVKHNLDNAGRKFDTHDASKLHPQTILARRLILSAGTLGSTFLLLKMRERHRGAFSRLSPRLGERFGGNGDFLMLASRAKRGTGRKEEPRVLDPSYGPVITSTVHIPDSESGGKGHYVQDGGYPGFVTWMLWTLYLPLRVSKFVHFVWDWLDRDPETDMGAKATSLFGNPDFSASVLPFLGMGRDVPDGRMELRKGQLNVDWKSTESRPYFLSVRKTMKDMANQLNARLRDTPLWCLSRFITVHPLGGCPMGADTEGVVDSYGKVVGYKRLYVADGSVMPGPVGPNPSLTIAALSDRFADKIIEEHTKENE